MKLCKNCRYYAGSRQSIVPFGDNVPTCSRNGVIIKTNPVTGRKSEDGLIDCDRSDWNVSGRPVDGCGSAGQFYEAPRNIGERVSLWLRWLMS